jgi:hypothetical protein
MTTSQNRSSEDHHPDPYPDLLARWNEATSDEVMTDAMRESKSAADSIASYLIFAFAIIDLRDFGRGSNLVAGLAIFVLLFLGGNFLKAFLARGMARNASDDPILRRGILTEETVRMISWGLTFLAVLLVQVRLVVLSTVADFFPQRSS